MVGSELVEISAWSNVGCALTALVLVACNRASQDSSDSPAPSSVHAASSAPRKSPPPPPVASSARAQPSADERVRETAEVLLPPNSRTVGEEPSRYGQFRRTYRGEDTCALSVSLAAGKPIDLFSIPECTEGGIVDLAAVRRVGAVEFPILASDGQEFHLFSIATAEFVNADETAVTRIL